MELLVDGNRVSLSEFDDSRSLRNWLALRTPDTLPSYFRIVPSGDRFVTSNLLDEIRKMTYEDLKNTRLMAELKGRYPFVFYPEIDGPEDMRTFSGAWLSVHGYSPAYLSVL